MLKAKSRLLFIIIPITFIGILLIISMAFINLAPQFGAKPSGKHLEKISKSPNYKDSKFVNLIETKMDYSLSNMWGMTKDALNAKNTSPEEKLDTQFGKQLAPPPSDTSARVSWYGHSAILLEIEGKRIFLDPMLGPAASPVPFFAKRFGNNPPFDIESIGYLDAVIYSHDHYDHLDYASVIALKENVGHFFTPLGLGTHLIKWGVDPSKITELDWWESASLDKIKLIATPARHFSGRSIGDSNKTLWASWVVRGEHTNIYFSGDSGYGPHFREIGNKYGPFDLAMIECGQYNERWKVIHMMPDQSVQAAADLRGKLTMPIHWGTFSLAPHSWTEPAEQITALAEKSGIKLITPRLGESFEIATPGDFYPWWRQSAPQPMIAVRPL